MMLAGKQTRLLLVAVGLMVFAGCGKKGPLIYPDMLVAQPPDNLMVEQHKDSFRLSFNLPSKDLSGRTLTDLKAVMVSRQVTGANDCKSCLDSFQELQRVDPEYPAPAQRSGNQINMIDADLKKGEQYRYRLQAVQQGDIFSEHMTTALLELKPLPSAPALTAKNSFGGFVTIDIKHTVTATKEAEPVAVRIYRSEADGAGSSSLATLPSEQTVTYQDQTVHYGKSYQYLATVVVQYKDGLLVEGEPTTPVEVVVDDTFK